MMVRTRCTTCKFQRIIVPRGSGFSPVPLRSLRLTGLEFCRSAPARSPRDSETHFKVVVVSKEFEAVGSPVARHRLVNAALAEQFERGPLHALSIVAKTPAQWQDMVARGEPRMAPSPNCRGGDGSLPPRRG